jgi:RNA polymerase sigma factor (sigma-70 family)
VSRFTTTRWSVVLAAGDAASPECRQALEVLCEGAWYPLYAYARRSGRREEDAKDLVQGFFAVLLARGALGVADPERGRFRDFLLASFRNHMRNEHARASAQKRGGGRKPLSFDRVDPEGRYRLEPAHEDTPERAFLRAWALEVLERALAGLREGYEAKGKSELFAALAPCLTGADDRSHASRAEALGMTEGAVRVAVHRLKQRYRAALREEIAGTLGEDGAIEDEIRALFEALG